VGLKIRKQPAFLKAVSACVYSRKLGDAGLSQFV
jgi:hypothetical protein